MKLRAIISNTYDSILHPEHKLVDYDGKEQHLCPQLWLTSVFCGLTQPHCTLLVRHPEIRIKIKKIYASTINSDFLNISKDLLSQK